MMNALRGRRAEPAPAKAALAFASCLSAAIAILPRPAAGDTVRTPQDRLEEVVVTGSRLAAVSPIAALPVTVLDAVDLGRGGRDSVGQALQALPQNTGSPRNTNVNNGGDGSTRVSLRGLGEQRTLVLLNGRRFPNGGVGGDASVDLDMLPLSMIARVEVLNAGATAIHGADAVAGVVNVITRPSAAGVDLAMQHRQAALGDGDITRASASGGLVFGDGAWSLGIDYVRQQGVTQAQRAFSALPLTLFDVAGPPRYRGSEQAANGSYFVTAGNRLGLTPGRYIQDGPVGARGAGDYRLFETSRDSFNFAPYNLLQTPNERGAAWLLGNQPLGAAEFYAEGLWQRRESAQRLAPTPYVILPGAAPVLPGGGVGIPADNFYNPFGVVVPMGSRRFVELDERGFEQRVSLWRALLGLRGELGDWRWDVSASESRSTGRSREGGLLSSGRLAQALGPSGPDASGRVVCGRRDPATGLVPAAAVIADCVPVDLFGGAGSITREQLDGIAVRLLDRGTNTQRLANLGIAGPWGSLPAGELQWAVGAEYRRDAGSYRFDPLRATGVVGIAETDLPDAQFDAREAYVELRAPLLADAPWARSFDATAGLRLLDFSSFGRSSPWQLALDWAPDEAWSFTARHAQVLRAPSLGELYQANAVFGTIGTRDPCGNSPTAAQRVNCAAQGVPGGVYRQEAFTTYEVVVGGNPRLRPERGTSNSLGLGWSMPSANGLQLALNAFEIDVPGFVETPGEATLLGECANRGTPTVCGQIRRAPDGTLTRLTVVPQNFGRVVVEGIDHSGRLAFATAGGQLRLEWLASWLGRYDVQVFDGGDTVGAAGRALLDSLALPRWRGSLSADWTRGPWRLSYATQYVGKFSECADPSGVLPPGTCRRVDDILYHDVDGSYEFEGGLRLRAGIENLTDVEPPFINGGPANTDPATYRLLGRRWFVEMGMRWR